MYMYIYMKLVGDKKEREKKDDETLELN